MSFLAPEIAYLVQIQEENPKYDIFAADIYSLGLIIASLFRSKFYADSGSSYFNLFLDESIFESVSKLKGSPIKMIRKAEAYKNDKKDPKI